MYWEWTYCNVTKNTASKRDWLEDRVLGFFSFQSSRVHARACGELSACLNPHPQDHNYKEDRKLVDSLLRRQTLPQMNITIRSSLTRSYFYSLEDIREWDKGGNFFFWHLLNGNTHKYDTQHFGILIFSAVKLVGFFHVRYSHIPSSNNFDKLN